MNAGHLNLKKPQLIIILIWCLPSYPVSFHAPSRFGQLSMAAGSMLRRRQWPLSWIFLCLLLLAWKHVQLSHHSVSAAVSLGLQITNPPKKRQRGRREKWPAPVSRDLCQKCFSPQVICYSLGSSHCLLQRTFAKKREKNGERARNEREGEKK